MRKFQTDQSVREEIKELIIEGSRLHNKPCQISDIHMIMGNKMERHTIKHHLICIAEDDPNIKRSQGGYFYEGKEFITEFET